MKKPSKPPKASGRRSVGRFQTELDRCARAIIETALREHAGNVTHTSKALGVTRKALWKRMTTLGIDPAEFRE